MWQNSTSAVNMAYCDTSGLPAWSDSIHGWHDPMAYEVAWVGSSKLSPLCISTVSVAKFLYAIFFICTIYYILCVLCNHCKLVRASNPY